MSIRARIEPTRRGTSNFFKVAIGARLADAVYAPYNLAFGTEKCNIEELGNVDCPCYHTEVNFDGARFQKYGDIPRCDQNRHLFVILVGATVGEWLELFVHASRERSKPKSDDEILDVFICRDRRSASVSAVL